MDKVEGIAPVSQAAVRQGPARAEALRAAREFEAVMLQQSFEQMFKGVKAPAAGGGGHAERMWQSLMVEEMARSVAHAGGVGIADSIVKEIAE